MSEAKYIACAVSQGSILGPLLFMLYLNDMASAVSYRQLLYADDSDFIVSLKSVVTC